jgi:hypothetical protein
MHGMMEGAGHFAGSLEETYFLQILSLAALTATRVMQISLKELRSKAMS